MSRLLTPRTLLRTVLSLALLGFLLWRIDLDRAAEALRDADYVYVVPALALFGCAKLLVAQRWRLMMARFTQVPPLPALFGVLLVSNLANNVVPADRGRDPHPGASAEVRVEPSSPGGHGVRDGVAA